jgi:hypothetical protein
MALAIMLLLLGMALLSLLPLIVSGASAASTVQDPGIKGDGQHYLGLKRTKKTERGKLTMAAAPPGLPLKAAVDLSSELPPVGNQGHQGSCTAWAISYYYKTWSEKKEHTNWDLTNSMYEYSPSFVYNQINGGVDNGSYLDDAFNLLQNAGDVDIAEMPYDQNNWTTKPTAAQLQAARPYRIPGDWGYFWFHEEEDLGPYRPPNDISGAKACLDGGKILVMGIPVYHDFPDDWTNPKNTYYDYDDVSSYEGGHAVAICGYDDNINPQGIDADHRGGFLMVNSWGPDWNDNGFVYLSYDFVKRYVCEAWAMGDLAPDGPSIASLSTGNAREGQTVAVNGHNFGTLRRSARVTFNGTTAAASFTDGQVTATVPAGATSGPVIVYDWDGKASNSMPFVVDGPSTWYLAEGTNAWGFSTYITIANPNAAAVSAKLTYMNPNPPAAGKGIIASRTIALAPLSQTTVSSASVIGNVDFSTKVECLEEKAIAVDRTMFWTGEGATTPGYHSSIGTNALSKTWYLPEGSSAWGFETWILVLNPNDTEANLTLTYMTEDAGAKTVSKKIPANSRATYSMASDIGTHDASIQVASDVPVVAERSVYRNNRREGSCSIGATTPANDYFLAEGAVGYDVNYTTYVLVQNPQASTNDVSLTYRTASGAYYGPAFTMQPNSRWTIRVDVPPNTDVSTQVHGSKPIIAERAMYWDNGTGEAFHASIGLSSPHMSFLFPDGQTSEGFETWTLVANPNPGAVRVRITYLPQGGGKSITFTDEIPKDSRRSYSMAAKLPAGRASILVESLDGARPVMVERAMYMNSRGAGTDTIGGFSD